MIGRQREGKYERRECVVLDEQSLRSPTAGPEEETSGRQKIDFNAENVSASWTGFSDCKESVEPSLEVNSKLCFYVMGLVCSDGGDQGVFECENLFLFSVLFLFCVFFST